MSSIRQQIVSAIKTRMATITKTNGYSFNVETVAEWQMIPFEQTDLPAVEIRDQIDNMPRDGVGNGHRDHDLTIQLSAEFAEKTAVTSAREALADLVAAVGTDPTWGGLAYDSLIDDAQLVPDSANRPIGFAQVLLIIRFRSNLWSM